LRNVLDCAGAGKRRVFPGGIRGSAGQAKIGIVKPLKVRPCLVCVTGLKNSGKTTVCAALIGELTDRGYIVAALKSSHVSRLALDHHSGDSYALAESGAHFLLVQGSEQSLIYERGARSFRQMLRRVPENVDFIVSEGGEARTADAVIVCLGDPADWDETLRVRRIPEEKILGVAGSFVRDAGKVKNAGGRPVLDASRVEDRKILAKRILEAAT
jgi:molybdopterin-guanine dinucleotide biosynthesis protein MobB